MPNPRAEDEMATSVVTDGTAPDSALWSQPTKTVTPGRRLGRYLVIEELGRGGMGIVVRAYDPKLQREVALKLVRTDKLENTAHERLVREARAMARLSHPNVVAVYDVELDLAGTEGVVLVMEYVPGVTLRAWLEARPRGWAEIVAVLCAAGRGLAAAHAQGLLHRDFKLENVLVGPHGDAMKTGVPARVRVTDFGLARPTSTSASMSGSVAKSRRDDPIHSDDDGLSVEVTAAGTVMGTPPYMAPEQLAADELDARADQYAFCVALWRALSGQWPFRGRTTGELLRSKSKDAPIWPSDVAVPRHVVHALRRGLRADPAARWPSMAALLSELGRDPSRRRIRVFTIVVVAIAAAGTWGWRGVTRSRALAACVDEGDQIEQIWNEARADEMTSAFEGTGLSYAADTWRRSKKRIEAYADNWRSTRSAVCRQADIEQTLPPDTARAARACLDERRDGLDAVLTQLAEPDATVVRKTARAAASLPQVARCTDTQWLSLRAAPPDDARQRVDELRRELSRATAAVALGRYEQSLRLSEALLDRASALHWAPLTAEVQLAVGDALEHLGRFEEAATVLETALYAAGASGQEKIALRAATSLLLTHGVRLAKHDDGLRWGRIGQMWADHLNLTDDPEVARLLSYIGAVHTARGEYDEALSHHRRVLEIVENAMGVDHPDLGLALNNLGMVHEARGAYPEALEYYRRALAIFEDAYGPDHPFVAALLNNLGIVHRLDGSYAEAEAAQVRALEIRERALGPEHPDTATSLHNLGGVHYTRGAYDQARSYYERALAIRRRALPADHPHVAMTYNNLGAVCHALGEYDEALEHHQKALEIREKKLDAEHPDVAMSLTNLGDLYRVRGNAKRALAHYERALEIQLKSLGNDHPAVAATLHHIGTVHQMREANTMALTYHERALAIRREALASDHPDLAASYEALGTTHAALGAHAAAVTAYEQSLAIHERSETPPHQLAAARFQLATALWDAGMDRRRAHDLATLALEGYRALGADYDDALGEVRAWLAEHHVRAG